MARVAALIFEHVQGRQLYRVRDESLPLRTPMVAMTRFGLAVGTLVEPLRELDAPTLPEDFAEPATEDDLRRDRENRTQETEDLELCIRYVARHDLPMKLARAFLSLDARQLTFFYSAPGRVDFRGLLRDLVREFRSQIRLEQVGDRDIARLLGGLGRCGRELCCCTWLSHFDPISMSHAREQGLAAVPTQLAGCCGRLRCCLRFELDEDETAHRPCDLGVQRKPVKTAAYHLYYDDPEDFEDR